MIYLITKPSGKVAYYSFKRLLKDENIDAICKKTGEPIPDKNNLPVRLAYNQIKIEEIELNEKLGL